MKIRFANIATIIILLLCSVLPACQPKPAEPSGWDLVPEILARIVPPVFPDRDFPITEYGAVEGGTELCTEAFRSAIDACNAAGGGRVVVPSGKFLTGAIHLKSNVNLHLAEGSTVLFSTSPEQYLPYVHTRWEGIELMNYSPLIYAFEQENIAVTGSGTLDGQADNEHWWPWVGVTSRGWKPGMPSQRDSQPIYYKMAADNVPVEERVFPKGTYLRPHFVQPYRSKNILIEGVTVINAPFWIIQPNLCVNVTVRGVTVRSHGPNNDGCNPESSRDVLIENCNFDTGDDCLAIKAGRNEDGRRVNVPSENIIIRNCRMKDGHGGVVIGSEISGGVRNVYAEDCEMDSPNLNVGLRIKTNSTRGGFAENIFLRNIRIGEVGDVVSVNYYYPDGDAGTFPPSVRNIRVENVTSTKSNSGLRLYGYPRSPVTDIHLENCRFDNAAHGTVLMNVQRVTAKNVTINGQPFEGIAEDMVPQAVLTTLEAHMPQGAHVWGAAKLRDEGAELYQYIVKSGGQYETLIIAPDGELKKREPRR